MARICFEARFWRNFRLSALWPLLALPASIFGAFWPDFRLLGLKKVSELTYISLLSKISKLIYKPFMTKNSVLS